MWTRCPFCHARILTSAYAEHERSHTRRRADGQMDEHVTLPPEQRLSGELTGVPHIYYHRRCGAATEMPDEIIRSYLRDPFLYNGTTFCTGCHDYVPERELTWTETGESVSVYMQRLKDGFLAERGSKKLAPASARREFSLWRVLILLLILIVVVPALVIDTGMALHALRRPQSVAPSVPTVARPQPMPPQPVTLPPPVVLASPPPPTPITTPTFVPRGSFRPGLPNPVSNMDQSALIRQAANDAIPSYIRRYHPVQTATGSLTVRTMDVLQSSFAQAIVTVHYEVTDTQDPGADRLGAAQFILQRRGAEWVVLNASPIGSG